MVEGVMCLVSQNVGITGNIYFGRHIKRYMELTCTSDILRKVHTNTETKMWACSYIYAISKDRRDQLEELIDLLVRTSPASSTVLSEYVVKQLESLIGVEITPYKLLAGPSPRDGVIFKVLRSTKIEQAILSLRLQL